MLSSSSRALILNDFELIVLVVDKFLVELQSQLDEKKVLLDVNDDARIWLVKNGYDPKMGARLMARLIQNSIRRRLVDRLLFGELSHGGTVHVGVNNDELSFEFEGIAEKVT